MLVLFKNGWCCFNFFLSSSDFSGAPFPRSSHREELFLKSTDRNDFTGKLTRKSARKFKFKMYSSWWWAGETSCVMDQSLMNGTFWQIFYSILITAWKKRAQIRSTSIIKTSFVTDQSLMHDWWMAYLTASHCMAH